MPFVVAIVSILVLIGMPLAAWMLFRYFAHRERLEMIRRGYVPSSDYDTRATRYGADSAYAASLSLRRGVSLAFIGLMLLVGLSFIGYSDGRFVLGPWLLGGVIPFLAGIAQIVTALIAGGRARAPDESAQSRSGWPPPAVAQSDEKDRR